MGKEKIKKILLIVGFLVLVYLIGLFIWKTFFRGTLTTPSPPEDDYSSSIGQLPISPDGDPWIIGDDEDGFLDVSPETPPDEQDKEQSVVIEGPSQVAVGGVTKSEVVVGSKTASPALSRDGNSVQFYNQDDGKFYITNNTGDLLPLSDRVFHNVKDVEWAPNKTKAVIEYPDKTKIIYDFTTNKQVTLPKHWEDFTFSPDSEKLVNKSLGIDPDNRWLVISDSNGAQTRTLEYIGKNDFWVIPEWSPNNQSVGMFTEGVDANRREVFFIGEYGQNMKSTIVEGWGFQPLWAPKGDKLLYSVYSRRDDYKPKIWVVDAYGDNIGANRRSLSVETWADKCTFSSDSEIYCAVPVQLEKMSGAFPETAMHTPDELYKINIHTGQKTLIATTENNQSMKSLMVDKDEKTLYFTDQITGQIHKIDLK